MPPFGCPGPQRISSLSAPRAHGAEKTAGDFQAGLKAAGTSCPNAIASEPAGSGFCKRWSG